MSDDNNSTAVTVTDSQGSTHDDANLLAGDTLEQTAYDYAATWPAVPPQSAVDHSSIYSYWISGSAASRDRSLSLLPALTANATGVTEQWNRQAITDTGTTTWRQTATDTTYYSATTSDPELGLPKYSYSLGDLSQLASPAEQTCTTTSYIEGTAGTNIVLPAETQAVQLPCGGTSTGTSSAPPAGAVNALAAPTGVTSANIVSDSRTFYDDAPLATTWPQPASSAITWPQAAPANTEASVVQKASSYSGGTFTYQTVSASTYNSYGQVTAAYDGNGGHNSATAKYAPTATAYTVTDGSDTAETVTNPLGQATTTSYDPARGLPVTATDPNGIITTEQYDELGRLTGVWEDSRASATTTANYAYTYTLGSGASPTVVTTRQLNDEGGTITSTALYDALLRPRQTQYPTPEGGILITDDFYDSHGWLWKVNHDWWDPPPPGGTLNPGSNILTQDDSLVPDQTVTGYDALGRPVEVTSYDDSAVRSVAYTSYTGDKTITIPAATGTSPITPVGATPTATVTDAIGRTGEQDSYTTWPAVTAGTNAGGVPVVTVTGGATQATSYGYDSRGLPATITAGGQQWTKTYNLLGRVSSAASPNSGTTHMTYDADGNLTQATDANGTTTTWTYDPLSRKTGEYDGTSAAAPPIATWAYDNSNNVPGVTDPIGQLTTATSYDQNGEAFSAQQSGFNVFGESLGQTLTVPADQGALAGSYAYQSGFSATTGLPLAVAYPPSPAFGGTSALPAETVSTGYATGFDLPATVSANAAGYRVGYVADITYTAWTQAGQEELGTAAVNAFLTNTFDPNTGQLTDAQVTNTAAATAPYDDTAYGYDPSGNITSETDTRTTAAAGTQAEQQCFGYSTLDRLTQAWTTAVGTACTAGPSTGSGGTVGDGIPGGAYWTQWQYNPLGDQATETDHSLTGGTSTLTAYTYNNGNGTGTGQPDTLTSAATTGGATGTSAWTYDPDGNTTSASVTAGGSTQDECYDYTPARQLSQAWPATALPCPATPPAGSTPTTSYVYDASGNLLAADNPGSDTIYLPGEQITATTDSSGNTTAITGIRFIPLPGGGQVVRTGPTTSYSYETADQHGTSLLTLDRTLQNPAWRQFTPYGAPRGTAADSWPDTNGYLGDPVNPADNLTTIGARQYNPATGRFLTPDPVLEAGDPNQMGGYAYAADNPISQSDPTGLTATGPQGSNCSTGTEYLQVCGGSGTSDTGTSPGSPTGPNDPLTTPATCPPYMAGCPGLATSGGSPVQRPMVSNETSWISDVMSQLDDLGTDIQKTPIGAQGGDIEFIPIGDLGGDIEFIPIGDLGPEILKTPIGNLGGIVNTSDGGSEKGGSPPEGQIYVWEPGRPETDNEPQGPLPPGAPLIERGQDLEDGWHEYVVMEDGSLRGIHSDDLHELVPSGGHTSLAERQPIIMGGGFKVEAGEITEFNNYSGHYMPHNMPGYVPMEEIARAALGEYGLPEPGPEAWDYFPF